MSTRPTDLVTTYLEDHRAGAAGGVALARRIADRYGDQPGFESVVSLAADIRDDERSLDAIREATGADGGCVKRVAAVVGERLARLKLNGTIVRASPLSRVIELEALTIGVAGKRSGWLGLRAFADGPELAGVDLDELVQRADAQIDELGRLHALACELAFGDSDR